MNKMKRVASNSRQSNYVNEEARVRSKHQILLEDFLELQKEFVAKKKKLQMVKQKKEILLAEVRFLRRRHSYLSMETQKPEQQDCLQPQYTLTQSKLLVKDNKTHGVNEAVKKKASSLPDLNPALGGEGGRAKRVETLRVEKKPKNCSINGKRVGKKKISWQDQVVLEAQ